MIKNSLLLLILLALVCSCDSMQSASPTMKKTVLEDLANDYARAGFERLSQDCVALREATQTVCNSLSAVALGEAREAWKNVRVTQKQLELIQFGPIKEYPLRLGPLLDTWPVNEKAIEDLTVDGVDLSQSAFDTRGSKHRGVPVLEYLLWRGEPTTLGALTTSTRRCEVLVAVAMDLETTSSTLLTTWTRDWIPQLTGDAPGETYTTLDEALDEWVNRMAFTIENIRVDKLEKPAGYPEIGAPKPDILESPFSDHSHEDATNALRGVQSVWDGIPEIDSLGISSLVNSLPLRLNMKDAFQQAAEAIAQIPSPLSETIQTEFDSLEEARMRLRALQKLIQEEVAPLVGVRLSFNDGDGD